MSASLYIVSTPIGNLNDMTQRAVEVLSTVDLIAAEDTRHSKRLLDHFNISTPMVAYHDFSRVDQTDTLIAKLQEGKNIALISDAGTPLISDPGFLLVRSAHLHDVNVVPVPGACAFVAALSASGLATDRFSFQGFLSAKKGARISFLEGLEKTAGTLVFYEAPHRVLDSIEAMKAIFGSSRQAVLAREMTKTFETIKKMPLGELYDWVKSDSNQQRGEIVILVEGYRQLDVQTLSEECKAMAGLLRDDLAPKKISKILSKHFGHPSKTIYDYIISLKNSE